MLTTVHREISPWDAHIVAGRLRVEGLHPSVQFEHHVRMVWKNSMAFGMVQIQVPLAEAAHAREVLADWRNGLYQEALEDELGLPGLARCPRCGRCNWLPLRDTSSRWLACVMLFLLSLTIIGRRCRVCGHVEHFGNFAEDAELQN